MDIIAQNIANAQVTKTADGTPYRRKMAVLTSIEGGSFQDTLNKAIGHKTAGVQVSRIVDDPSPLVPVYDPAHPDANEDGYVMLPNVNTAQEMIDMLGASRAYESNVTAFNALKSMALKALEIGR
jgi:flagellar basal-body rod protein FlgC